MATETPEDGARDGAVMKTMIIAALALIVLLGLGSWAGVL